MGAEDNPFAFLESRAAIDFFAETDFLLRKGRHIQNSGSDRKVWEFIQDYFENLEYYYSNLYGVKLTGNYVDSERYFFLEFSEESKGKFSGQERSRELSKLQVVFGVLLLNFFNDKHFEKKLVNWEELNYAFFEGEHRNLWQRILMRDVKSNYSPNELEEIQNRMKTIINEFEKIGWVQWQNKEEMIFEILPSIDRLSRIYSQEIQNVNLMIDYINERLS